MAYVSFDDSNYVAQEGDGSVEVCIVLDGLIQREVVVELSTFNGLAIGND